MDVVFKTRREIYLLITVGGVGGRGLAIAENSGAGGLREALDFRQGRTVCFEGSPIPRRGGRLGGGTGRDSSTSGAVADDGKRVGAPTVAFISV